LQLPYAIEKCVFTVMTILKLGLRVVLFTGAITAVTLGVHVLIGQPVEPVGALEGVLLNPWYQVSILALAAVHLRLILLRMADKARTL
jgi:hypothetical protein